MRIKASGRSDVGRARSHNEDSLRIDLDRGLVVVADGMGGHGHGEVASRLAVEAIVTRIGELLGRGDQEVGDGTTRASSAQALETAIKLAHLRVVEAVADDSSLVGMGTTVVGLLASESQVAVAHVGDSRAYRLRQGELRLVTEDHTWVHEQVKAGYLSREQARSHPLKSVVTRAVGGDHAVEVDVRELDVAPGDLFLLCSDGLTTMLSDEQILTHLAAESSLEDRCQRLIDDANAQGGVDNITVALVEVSAVDPS